MCSYACIINKLSSIASIAGKNVCHTKKRGSNARREKAGGQTSLVKSRNKCSSCIPLVSARARARVSQYNEKQVPK